MCSVDTAQVACLSKYRKLFLALWQAVKPLKITMTCKKRKKQYVSSYIPMRHTRIYCIRVCAYMHTRMCVYAYAYVRICIRVYAYWADAHYAYILVRTYLSCTVALIFASLSCFFKHFLQIIVFYNWLFFFQVSSPCHILKHCILSLSILIYF